MNNNVQNERYASLELQISMAQDYSEWLKQETKRNNELLESHSTALRRLKGLIVQSPSGDEKIDSGTAQELPDGLKWEDAPRWADRLARYTDMEGNERYVWYNSDKYMYIGRKYSYPFHNIYYYKSVDELDVIATRSEGV